MNVHDKLFGVNFLFTKTDSNTAHDLYQNGTSNQEDYLTRILEYGFKSFRYPGGSITENEAYENPMIFFDNAVTASLQEAINASKNNDLKINLVLPSWVFDQKPETITPFFNKLKTYDLSTVDTIEIGNEYWAWKDETETERRFTETQYGKFVNSIIPTVNNVRNTKCPNAKIFIQSAPSWKRAALTSTIHNQITENNLKLIDGDVDHWYPNNVDKINSNYFFEDKRNDTDNPPVYLGLKQTPQRTINIKNAQGKTWLYAVSEFNVNAKTSEPVMFGIDQGFMLSKMIWKMAKLNISYAQLWGFHYQNLESKITGVRNNGDYYDQGGGSVYKQVLKLSGWTPVQTPSSLEGLYHSTYKKGDVYTTFLRTTGEEITIPNGHVATQIFKFIPKDDPETGWVDESIKGTQQQASVVNVQNPASVKILDKWTHYMVKYKIM